MINGDEDGGEQEFLKLAERLAKIASWREELLDNDDEVNKSSSFKVPTVRFGKTNLQMPIITCGGMRIQETWIPDTIPLLKPNKRKVVKSPSQMNLKDVIQCCLKIGLNHFETARFYVSCSSYCSFHRFVQTLTLFFTLGIFRGSNGRCISRTYRRRYNSAV